MRLPRLSPAAYRWITLVTLIALCIIIVTGGLVRLTGSGLGCSDWPTCEEGQFVAALDSPHALVEFGNRLFTGIVGIAIIVAVLGALVREPRRPDLVRWSLGLVAGLLGNAVLGGIVVLVGLLPGAVSGHFLLSIVLVWNAFVLHHRAGQPDTAPVPIMPAGYLRLSRVMVALSLVVLVTGTIVTGAGPHAGDERAERLPWAVSTVVRYHGLTVWILLGVVAVLLARAASGGAPAQVIERGRTLLAAVVLQGAVGYTQYFTGVPWLLVALHLLGATLVWMAVLHFHLGLWTRPEPTGPPGPAADEPRVVAAPEPSAAP